MIHLWHLITKQQTTAESRTPSKKAMTTSSHGMFNPFGGGSVTIEREE